MANKTSFFLMIIFVFFCTGSSFSNIVSANEWADIKAYFTWMKEDGSWHEWVGCTTENSSMLDEIHLKVGQPVKCKMTGYTFQRCVLTFEIWEPGSEGTEAFDVIEGQPHDIGVAFYVDEHWKLIYLEPNTSVEYVWVLQPNGNFTKGNAPLNAFWEITKPSVDEKDITGNLGFTQAYIEDALWTGPSYNNPNGANMPGDTSNGDTNIDSNNKSTPGFELQIILFAIIFFILFIQRQRKK